MESSLKKKLVLNDWIRLITTAPIDMLNFDEALYAARFNKNYYSSKQFQYHAK